jgi:Asp-tRNA(Asn)/Glu-tRNA(Gln) amidotransferase A subunit family amidase
MTVAGGKVASYEPKMDDAKADPTEELKKQIAELQAQLEAKTNEATQANAEKAKIEASLQSEFKNLKIELDALKSKTFGDPTLPGTDPEFKEEKEPVAEYGIPSFMNDVAGIFKTKLNNK